MPRGERIERPDEWKRMHPTWAIQADVLDAMIRVLKIKSGNVPERLIRAIVENDLSKPLEIDVRVKLGAFLNRRYKKPFRQVLEQFLHDLEMQRALLKEHNDIPPFMGKKMSSKIYRMITAHYAARLKRP